MAEKRVQRRLAAILAADVVGYSRLVEADEAGTVARLKSIQTELLQPMIARDGGRVVKVMGDGVLVEFGSAVDAVRNALAIQTEMARRNADVAEMDRITFRVGINVGDVIVEGDDIHGDGVNVASRLEGLCKPGGVYVSGTVYDQATGKLSASFEDLGEKTVKNITRPVRVYAVRASREEPDRTGGEANALPLPSRPSIAVLPFDNMSGDPEQEYFTDGLTDDIITTLSYQRIFPVIAHNSTFAYKGTSPDIKKVGAELGARYVLEGSVRKGGNRLRISAQLIDATTGHHIWAENFNRDLDDIFVVQEEITERIVGAVEPEIGKVERRRVVTKRPDSLDAWDHFQRGMAYLYEYTEEGNAKAHEQFAKVTELDPNFSGGFTGQANVHHRDIELGFAEATTKKLAKVFENARAAITLDDRDSVAHLMLGIALLYAGEHDQSIAEVEEALALNPSSYAQIVHGAVQSFAGRPEEGIAAFERAFRLSPRDPRNYLYYGHFAHAQFNSRHYEDAARWARKSLRQLPENAYAQMVLAATLGHLGHEAQARQALGNAHRLKPSYAQDAGPIFPYKNSEDREHYLEGLRKAGWEG